MASRRLKGGKRIRNKSKIVNLRFRLMKDSFCFKSSRLGATGTSKDMVTRALILLFDHDKI